MKKRKVGPSKPRSMSEFLIVGDSASKNGSSSQSGPIVSHTIHTAAPALAPPPPPPPPPPPLPLDQTLSKTGEDEEVAVRLHNKGVPEWNTGVKIQVHFNETFQPVGDKAQLLKSQLGIIVRDGQRVPLTATDWKFVDKSIKEAIWTEVKANVIDVPEGFKVVCLRMCNHMWKDHKGKIKRDYYVKRKVNPELLSKCPPRVLPNQWPALIAYWSSADAQEQSLRNSKNRDKHGPIHVTGRKSFAEVRYEMTQKGEAVDKMSVWIKSRNPNDHDVLEAINDYNNLLDKEPEDQ